MTALGLKDYITNNKRNVTTFLMLLWGIVCAIYCVYTNLEPTGYHSFYAVDRVDIVNRGIALIAVGEPVWVNHDGRQAQWIFYPYLASMLGITSSNEIFLFVQMFTSGLAFSILPLFFYWLTRNFFIGLFSPLLIWSFCGEWLFQTHTDFHWASYWIIIVSMPLLIILYRRKWDRLSWFVFASLCICISFSNMIRAQSALPALIAVLVIIYLKLILPAWKSRNSNKPFCKSNFIVLFAIVTVILSYILLETIMPAVYSAINGTQRTTNSEQFWHSLYIGLGWEENPFGIVYTDEFVLLRAVELGADIYTRNARDVIREEYLMLMRENAAFFISSYIRKFFHIIITVSHLARIPLLMSCVLYIVAFVKNRTLFKKYLPALLIITAGLLIGCIEAMIAVPTVRYLFGSIAAANLIPVIAVIAALDSICPSNICRHL